MTNNKDKKLADTAKAAEVLVCVKIVSDPGPIQADWQSPFPQDRQMCAIQMA